MTRGAHFRFGSVFIKKITKQNFFKKNRNRFKPTGFGSVFRTKTGSNWFGLVFSVWLGLARFFQFQAYKTETEPAGFFKILIGLIIFFHSSVLSVIFFCFLGLIGFSVFLFTPKYDTLI